MKSWPKMIFLESSVLVNNLPLDIVNAEIQQLCYLCGILGINIYMPEITFKEWIYKNKNKIKKYISSANTNIRELNKVFKGVPKINWENSIDEMIKDYESFAKRTLGENKIEIIPTHNMDLNMLVDMAVEKVRPFEEKGEKGFRDTLNLHTILNYAKNLSTKNRLILLITADKVYHHENVKKIVKEYDIDMSISGSISDTVIFLNVILKDVKKKVEIYTHAILKKFLIENKDKIVNFVKENGEFDYKDLVYFYRDIEAFNYMKLKDIKSSMRGILSKNLTTGRIKISFAVILEINLKVKRLRGLSKIKYGEAPSSAFLRSALMEQLLKKEEQFMDISADVNANLEGTVFLKKGDSIPEDQYSDLELNSVIIQ